MNEFLEIIGVGRRLPDDKFFDDSYKICKIFVRKGVTIIDDEELCHETMKEFPCNVPGCVATFNTLFDFEMHYNGSHRYICLECKKSRPSARLLDIHIQETHDSFFQVSAERQAMYQCYVAECDTKFKTPDDRREHCVTVHKYPKNYRFDKVPRRKDTNEMEVDKDSGPQKIRKQCSPRLNKNQKTKTFHPVGKKVVCESMTNSEVPSSLEVPEPQHRVSFLSFVPRQVTSYSKVLTKNKNLEKDVLNNGSLLELAEALPP